MSEEVGEDGFSVDPEYAKVERKIIGLKQTNMRMAETIEQAGARINLGEARVERLMHWLREHGIIDYAQQLDEQVTWELHLRSQLQPVFEQIKRAMEVSGAPKQTDSGLIIPGVNAPRNMKG